MNISLGGIRFIQKWEGCKLIPYRDVAGYLTIGTGHLITAQEASKYKNGITQERADLLLRHDLRSAENAVNKLVTVPLTQPEFDSLVSFTFNCGANALKRSTLRMRLNRGNRAGASAEFVKWSRAGGRVVRGLLLRRLAERQLFLGLGDAQPAQ